jgi:lysozyme family protein
MNTSRRAEQTPRETIMIEKLIADVIDKEGGYVNHPADKGGPTKYGITAMSYAEYFKCPADSVTIVDIKSVTQELASKIYRTLYYARSNIILLPELIQPIMFDMAVNHGRRGAVKILQKALIAEGLSFAEPDGIIGRVTIDQAWTADRALGKHFIASLVNQRIEYYNAIIEKDPSQAAFKNGWIARAESFRPEVA